MTPTPGGKLTLSIRSQSPDPPNGVRSTPQPPKWGTLKKDKVLKVPQMGDLGG